MRVLSLLLAALGLAGQDGPAGPDSCWASQMSVTGEVQDACRDVSGAALGPCLRDFMRRAGASAEAIAFSEGLPEPGFLRQFIPSGRIAFGRVHFPFRANTNDAVYLLNGDPARIDVADSSLLKRLPLSREPLYRKFDEKDRHPFLVLDGVTLPERVPTFVDIRYMVPAMLRRCRACEDLALARVAYDFTDAGKFKGVKLLSLEEPKPPKAR